ncbi:tetratricopeptide repeat-containing sensor histidine kinase [Reichenbachiella sp.]|uniref:tetratricopeptide repeat-containing sensor histidine kinase n=1 Tax=Reichenbachiella sp. TaxID=2184521 RepID=UPI003BB1C280
MRLKYCLLYVFLSLNEFAIGQNQAVIDSLLPLLESNVSTQQLVDIYVQIADEYDNVDSAKTAYYANRAIDLATRIDYYNGISNAYYEIGWATMQLGYIEASKDLYNKVLSYAELGNYDEGRSNAYNGLGFIYRRKGEYDSSRMNFSRSLRLREMIGNKKGMSSTLGNIGATFVDQGNYPEALKCHVQSMKIAEVIQDKVSMSNAYHSMGLIFDFQKKYDKAIEYYNEALSLYQEIGNIRSVALIYNNLAVIAKNQSMDSLALEYHFKALKIHTLLDDKNAMSTNYANIGGIYEEQKKFKEALAYLNRAYDIAKSFGHLEVVCSALTSKGAVLYALGNYTESRKALSEGLELAKSFGYKKFVRDLAYHLSLVEESVGRYKEAHEAFVTYHQIYDSLLGKDKSNQLSTLEVQYETEKKEQEIHNLNQLATIQSLQLRESNLNLIILTIVLVAVFLSAVIIYLINRQKRLALNQKNQDMEQKLLRVQMNPHFIFNAMSAIQEFMVQGEASQASGYLSKFSKLIRQVLDNSRSDYIILDDEVNMLENYLSLQNLRRDRPFEYKIEIDPELDTMEVAIPPMFAQPFVENAIEHGLVDQTEHARIHISFSLETSHLRLQISDNGQGIRDSFNRTEGHISHATQITEERIKLFRQSKKRNILFDVKKLSQGTQVTFNLPFEYI